MPAAAQPPTPPSTSYELILLPCPPELAGPDAAAWFTSYTEPDGEADLSAGALAAWDAIVAAATALLPDAEVESSSEHAELAWPDLGLQLEFWPDEATVGLAYWHDGASAADLVMTSYRLAGIVSSHTGLRAFDPQLGLLADEAGSASAAGAYARTRARR